MSSSSSHKTMSLQWSISCPSCHAKYALRDTRNSNIPRILSCGHTCCEKCIKDATDEDQIYTCSTCKEPILLASIQTIQDIPLDAFALGACVYETSVVADSAGDRGRRDGAAQRSATNTAQSHEFCDECVQEVARWGCMQCAVPLCDDCFDALHKKGKTLRAHRRVPVWKLKTKHSASGEEETLTHCVKHQCPLDFFCSQDNVAVCSHCAITGDHKGHDIVSLEEISDKVLSDLDAMMVASVKSKHALLVSKKRIKECSMSYGGYFDTAARRARTAIHSAIACQTLRGVALLTQIEEHRVIYRDACLDALQQVEKDIESLEETRKKAREALMSKSKRNAASLLVKLSSFVEGGVYLDEGSGLQPQIELMFDPTFNDLICNYGSVEIGLPQINLRKLTPDDDDALKIAVENLRKPSSSSHVRDANSNSSLEESTTQGATGVATVAAAVRPVVRSSANVMPFTAGPSQHRGGPIMAPPPHVLGGGGSMVGGAPPKLPSNFAVHNKNASMFGVPRSHAGFGAGKSALYHVASHNSSSPSNRFPPFTAQAVNNKVRFSSVPPCIPAGLTRPGLSSVPPIRTYAPRGGVASGGSSGQQSFNSGDACPPFPELKSGRTVTVSHLVSPWEFYIRPTDGNKAVNYLDLKIGNYMQRNASTSTLPQKVARGDFVLALYASNKRWYRGRVTDVDEAMRVATVFFVDFGTVDLIEWTAIRTLPSEFASLPVMCTRCSLFEICPVDGTTQWPDAAIEKMQELLQLGNLTVQIAGSDSVTSSLKVDLMCNVKDADRNMSIADNLVFSGFARFGSPGQPLLTTRRSCAEMQKRLRRGYYSPLQPSVGSIHSVLVTNVQSPALIYLRVLTRESQACLDKLFSQLQDYCNSRTAAENPSNFLPPRVGAVCAARSSVDCLWHRAISTGLSCADLLEDRSELEIEVYFVDLGRREQLNLNETRYLPDSYLVLPAHALPVCLADISPPDGDAWPKEASEMLRKLIVGVDDTVWIQAFPETKFIDDLLNIKPVPVRMCIALANRRYGSKDRCVNALLVHDHLAKSTGVLSAVLDVDHPPPGTLVARPDRYIDHVLQYELGDLSTSTTTPFWLNKAPKGRGRGKARKNQQQPLPQPHFGMSHQTFYGKKSYQIRAPSPSTTNTTSTTSTSAESVITSADSTELASSLKRKMAEQPASTAAMGDDDFGGGGDGTAAAYSAPQGNLHRVKLLSYDSPDMFFVRVSQMSDKMFNTVVSELQTSFGNTNATTENKSDVSSKEEEQATTFSAGDKCAFRNHDGVWHRVVIETLPEGDGFCTLRSIDTGAPFMAKVGELRRLVQAQSDPLPMATRCHLACIRPAGGSKQWTGCALDAFKQLLEDPSNDAIYVKQLGEIDCRNSLPVDVIVEQITLAGPLEPSKRKLISVRESLADNGLAFLDKRSDATKSELLEAAVVVAKTTESSQVSAVESVQIKDETTHQTKQSSTEETSDEQERAKLLAMFIDENVVAAQKTEQDDHGCLSVAHTTTDFETSPSISVTLLTSDTQQKLEISIGDTSTSAATTLDDSENDDVIIRVGVEEQKKIKAQKEEDEQHIQEEEQQIQEEEEQQSEQEEEDEGFVWKARPLPLHKRQFLVIPSHIDYEAVVYVQNLVGDDLKTLKAMRAALTQQYSLRKPERRKRPLVRHQACVALYVDNLYYRGEIMRVDKDTCLIRFVDYGSEEHIPMEKIYTRNLTYRELPRMCYEVQLYGVVPFSSTGQFSLETLDKMHEMLVEKSVSMVVKSRGDLVHGIRPRVVFFLSEHLRFNDVLLENGLAIEDTSTEDDDVNLGSDGGGSSSGVDGLASRFLRLLDTDDSSHRPQSPALSSVCADDSVSAVNVNRHHHQQLQRAGVRQVAVVPPTTTSGFRDAELPTDGVVPIVITSMVSYNTLYAQRVEIKTPSCEQDRRVNETIAEFIAMIVKLRENVDKFPLLRSPYTFGTPCASKYPHDGMWYRAMIADYIREEELNTVQDVRVFYVDYGNYERVPLSSLRELPVEFMSCPIQAIAVKLFGVKLKPEVDAAEAMKVISDTIFTHSDTFLARIMGYEKDTNILLIDLITSSLELAYISPESKDLIELDRKDEPLP